jgi:hypothetical protein
VALLAPPGIRAFPNLCQVQDKPQPPMRPPLTAAVLPSVQSIERKPEMNGKHAITISLAVAVAAITGTFAATRTVQLGRPAAAQPAAAMTSVTQRTRQLDRAEIALKKALGQRPPKLPPLPAAVTLGSTATAPTPAQQRVLYVRPAPVIRRVHRPGGGEHEGDHEAAHDSQPDRGGFDD